MTEGTKNHDVVRLWEAMGFKIQYRGGDGPWFNQDAWTISVDLAHGYDDFEYRIRPKDAQDP